MELDDKVIVVTGGASGLGKAMVRRFLTEGAKVSCVDIDPDRLQRTKRDVADAPGEILAMKTDVRNWDEVQMMVETTRDTFGNIDVFVNNAAITQRIVSGGEPRNSIVDLPVDVWDTVLDTNLRGPFLCTKAVLPGMLTAGDGRLFHVSSEMGREATRRGGYAPYVASKHGLEGFCDSLADELSDTGVDSMILYPPDGAVYTQTREYLSEPERQRRHRPDVITTAAVRLAAGEGENGERYKATPDGEGLVERS